MPAKRRTVPQSVLRITRKYQRLFPERHGCKVVLGRISPVARPKYYQELTPLLVKDKTLARHLLATNLSDAERWKQIMDYALKKHKGNKQKAADFLLRATRQVQAGSYRGEALERYAKRKGLNEAQVETHVVQTGHMFSKWVATLAADISYCAMQLKKP